MDKNTKNSLLFGAVVGGLTAILQGKANKQKLTDAQLKVLNETKDSFAKLQSYIEGIGLDKIYKVIQEKQALKAYAEILTFLENEIANGSANLFIVARFNGNLQNILDPGFMIEKPSPKARESQLFFSKFRDLPPVLTQLLQTRVEILELIKKTFTRIKAEEIADFTPEDIATLQSLVKDFKKFEQRASGLLN